MSGYYPDGCSGPPDLPDTCEACGAECALGICDACHQDYLEYLGFDDTRKLAAFRASVDFALSRLRSGDIEAGITILQRCLSDSEAGS